MVDIKEQKHVVKEIREKSSKRPQRIVIDEILPDGSFRVLSAEMKPRKKDAQITDPGSWSDEEEFYMDRKQLSELLSEKQLKGIWEGQVFRIKQKRSKSISVEVKEHVKGRAKELLDLEGRKGKTRDEVKKWRR
ncbi:MAG: hypothetical protein JSW00_11725 [Thermoplasmata archaeon]|nr:MAG: hypothetical protein JSW00_11725 [Thermoplasmata archaeon]